MLSQESITGRWNGLKDFLPLPPSSRSKGKKGPKTMLSFTAYSTR